MNTRDVTVTLIPTEEDFQILDIFMEAGRIRPDVIRSLSLPSNIDPAKGVVISGRAPIWLYARLVHLCLNAPWVATYDPKAGAIIVVRRSVDRPQVGDVIPKEKVFCYLPKHSGPSNQEEPKPGIGSKAIAFLGPPHSGKSVLMNALRIKMQEVLPAEKFQRDFYVLRACPDGEGDWFNEIPQEVAMTLRYKNRFDDEFVNQICQALEQLRQQKQLLLVDCGGKIDRKNQRILNRCTHAVIVSRHPEEIPLWRGAAFSSELEILAEVESLTNSCAEVLSSSPLRIRLGKLERGERLAVPDELWGCLKSLIVD
ncbi:MAG: CRISPR-associated ring nuclease Crn3/Csx3 [Acidobacteriota bacterium]|nr:CRISPR-associated ring nuclease Crn3/Csx3 [Blastocatellia bacterium]MDW8241107.1 CRISPR-associated ring nuclease Crn3/Csx3 [Acidobacteriota bacterium]